MRKEWWPQSTGKLGWLVKMRSIQDNEFGNRWVGSDISWSDNR